MVFKIQPSSSCRAFLDSCTRWRGVRSFRIDSIAFSEGASTLYPHPIFIFCSSSLQRFIDVILSTSSIIIQFETTTVYKSANDLVKRFSHFEPNQSAFLQHENLFWPTFGRILSLRILCSERFGSGALASTFEVIVIAFSISIIIRCLSMITYSISSKFEWDV